MLLYAAESGQTHHSEPQQNRRFGAAKRKRVRFIHDTSHDPTTSEIYVDNLTTAADLYQSDMHAIKQSLRPFGERQKRTSTPEV